MGFLIKMFLKESTFLPEKADKHKKLSQNVSRILLTKTEKQLRSTMYFQW